MRKIVTTQIIPHQSHTDLLVVCEDGTIWMKQVLEFGQYVDDPWENISDQLIPDSEEVTNGREKDERILNA